MIPSLIGDAVRGGRADRCVSWVGQSRTLMVCDPLAVLSLPGELPLQQWDASSGRVDVRGNAQRTDAECAGLPRWAHGSRYAHHAWRVHTDGDEEVLSYMLAQRCGSNGVLYDQRVHIEGSRHGCFA